MDVEEDREHPEKKYRPIASGAVSATTAQIMIFGLAVPAFVLAFLLNLNFFLTLLVYYILNVAYSIKLKHIPIVDINIISIGFVLRLFAGSSASNTPLSMWIIIMTFLLALFLALAKRRDDVLLSREGKQIRRNINGYNYEFINASMLLMSSVIIVVYILYTVSDNVLGHFKNNNLYITTFFVILGIMRYMQVTFVEQKSGNPTEVLIKDTFLQITILLWIVSFIVVVNYL